MIAGPSGMVTDGPQTSPSVRSAPCPRVQQSTYGPPNMMYYYNSLLENKHIVFLKICSFTKYDFHKRVFSVSFVSKCWFKTKVFRTCSIYSEFCLMFRSDMPLVIKQLYAMFVNHYYSVKLKLDINKAKYGCVYSNFYPQTSKSIFSKLEICT